jgi:hypothetical protein
MTGKKKHTAETHDAAREPERSLSPQGVPTPVGDRLVYEQQMSALPAGDRELAVEVTRLADLSRYFSEREMQVPPHICREIIDSRKLPVLERAERMRDINDKLMEYLHSVSEDTEFRM